MAATALFFLAAGVCISAQEPPVAKSPTATNQLAKAFARPQLAFEPNRGQAENSTKFVARGAGYRLQLESTRAVMEFHDPVTPLTPDELRAHAPEPTTPQVSRTLTMDLVHSNLQPELIGESLLPGKTSYFRGNDAKRWITSVPTYKQVRYSSIYPGVDLSFYGNAGRLEYDFRVEPGAKAASIELAMSGADAVRVDDKGNLVLTVKGRDVRFLKPLAYQEAGSARQEVPAAYRVSRGQGGIRINFDLGSYDRSRVLIIDPVLDYGTYLPLSNESAMTVDTSGNVYVTGLDPSSPITTFDVLKYGADGTLLYTAAFQAAPQPGITLTGNPASIAVDASGRAYIAAAVNLGWPTTANAYQSASGGALYNAYLLMLDPTGANIEYASYLGGSYASIAETDRQLTAGDLPTAVAVDSAGNVYMTGYASSSDFPTTPGAYQTGYIDVAPPMYGTTYLPNASFVAKFNPSLSGAASLVYSTLIGDIETTEIGIAADSNGNAYVTGVAGNYYSTFPITPGAFVYGGTVSTSSTWGNYVTKLNANGSSLIYSAYLGAGSSDASSYGIAVDGSGDAYVTGLSNTIVDGLFLGGYAAELNPAGSALVYSTTFGGAAFPNAIAVAPGCVSACLAYVAGIEQPSSANYPDYPLLNAIQTNPSTATSTITNSGNGFLVELDGGGNTLFSTYFGGTSGLVYPNSIITNVSSPSGGVYPPASPGSPSIAVDGNDNIYIAGNITATDFPVTTAAAPTVSAAGTPSFLAKIGPANEAMLVAVPSALDLGSSDVGVNSASNGSSPPTITLTNAGSVAVTLTSFSVSPSQFLETNNCSGQIAAGGQCTLSPSFTPTAGGAITGTISIVSSGNGSPATITLTGTGVVVNPVTLSTTSLTFASQPQGSTSAAQTITLTNVGQSSLTPSIAVSGDFAETDTCGTSVAAGASCIISITFTPTATGARSGVLTITYSGPGSPETVSLSGTGTASTNIVATISPTGLSFPAQTDGTTSAAQTVTLTNTGQGALSLTSIAATGDFAQTNTCGTSVAIGVSCTISVTFTPTAPGSRTGTLSIMDNATGSPQTVVLVGTGVVAVTLSTSSLTFASQTDGTTSAAQTVTLTNSGQSALTLTSISASGDFSVTNACGASLAAAASCAVSVSFAPTAAGPRTGTLTITDSAAGSPQTVTLAGTGVAATPAATLAPTSLTFASQTDGTTSAAQTVTLTNSGTAALSLTSIATSGDFAQSNSCGTSVAAGAGCSVAVSFTPTAVGTRTGTLTITDNASGSPQTVALTGTGLAVPTPGVTLSPTSLTFASQTDGTTSAAQMVTLTNSGTAALALTSIASSGDFAETNTCGTSVAVGANCAIAVTFTPNAAGTRTGTITITDNAGDSPQTVPLSGGGEAVTVTSGSTGITIPAAGGSSTATIQLSPVDGFTGTVNLTCAVSYQGQGTPTSPPTCSLNPAQAQVTTNASVSSTLTISTTAASASAGHGGELKNTGFALAVVFMFGLIPRRRWRKAALTALCVAGLCLAVGGGMLGCGGGSMGGSTTPGTTTGSYQVVITATSGTATTSTTIPISVQ